MRSLFFIYILMILLSGCSGCSRSGRRQVLSNHTGAQSHDDNITTIHGNKTVVKMEKIDGVFQIPVEIDGVKMSFVFDTGASTISISESEASFLRKQGLLLDSDIKGNANFQDATGQFSEGTIINIKTVKIGDRVLSNIEASVVHNLNAPLLFGQSALARFGKIFIDNNNETITFE